MFKKHNVHYYKDNALFAESKKVPEEMPVTININREEFVTLLCTPTNLKELAVGFIAAEKIITKLEQIKEILIDEEKGMIWIEIEGHKKNVQESYGKRYLTSGCGRGTVFYQLSDAVGLEAFSVNDKFSGANIIKLAEIFSRKKDEPGGIHKAALIEKDKVLFTSIDVGRHNAADKVIGNILLEEKNLENGFLFTSGRISSEILTKVYTIGVPVIASLSSPTSLAVDIALQLNITLIGYVKKKSLVIYTVPERIEL